VTALNGPVLGLTAGLIAHSDFIYATENAFLLTPYTSIGLVTEGASSIAFVRRMGTAKAKEALILSKRIDAQELLESGFVNKIFPSQPDGSFRESVLAYVKDQFGDHLNGESMLKAKALIRAPEMDLMEQQNAKEVFGGLERFMLGIPQEEFRKIASGAKRHKL
jgi:peroxisomal 3,2-trans-enoyl-CoA isomerase